MSAESMTRNRAADPKLRPRKRSRACAATGGFGLVFPEQIAIQPDGRASVSCAGIYTEDWAWWLRTFRAASP